MLEKFQEIKEHREFLREYVLQTLRSRYRGSLLGFFWTLLNPLLLCLVFSFVFAVINRVNIVSFMPYFLAGYIPWLFFANTTTNATTAIVGNAHYVSRVFVPKAMFPLAAVLVNLVDMLAAFAVFLVLLVVFEPTRIQPALLFLPVAAVALTVFCTGFALLCATVNVFFRDFNFLWNTLTMAWFFLTPIFYRLEQMNESVRPFFALNIVYPFIRMFQDPIALGVLPPAETILSGFLYSAIVLIVGASVFFRSEERFYMYV